MPAQPARSETGDPLLLTPGPLTTAKSVKEVMVHDWGSRDATFLRINAEVLQRLPEIVNGGEGFVAVPMQGSGTFAVEAMLTTFVPRAGKVLLRSAKPGTGIIAGGPMRAVFETLGMHDVVAKSTGSSNPYNMVRATFDALKNQMHPKDIAAQRGLKYATLQARRASAGVGSEE